MVPCGTEGIRVVQSSEMLAHKRGVSRPNHDQIHESKLNSWKIYGWTGDYPRSVWVSSLTRWHSMDALSQRDTEMHFPHISDKED
ncbi:hypothetical protein AOLI_G00217740 [Acnodon oligacanthus]